MPKINVKRAYEPVEKTDGTRILVDRLWPRGVSKAKARLHEWAKDAAPSAELRQWFHENPERRFAAFSKKYATELKKNPAAAALRKEIKAAKNPVTLVTAAKDPSHSHVPTLRTYLR